MIKVNINTLEVERVPIPKGIIGLKPETLRNLQSDLIPVPPYLIDIEFWPENKIPVSFDYHTHKIEGEDLGIDVPNKIVDVTPIVISLTQNEIDEIATMEAETQAEIDKKEGVENARIALSNIKKEADGKPLNMVYLDKRLSEIETILGVE